MPQPAPSSYDAPPGPDAPRPSRRPVVIALAASFGVLALAVVVPVAVQRLRGDDARQAAVDRTLEQVRDYRHLRRDHTDQDVDYPQVPPVGGPHDPAWLDCGAYDAPVRDENAVHDLEHGSVWISYRPGLSPTDVGTLAGALPHNGILAPYDGLPAPVVVTVWGHQLQLTGADDPRLPLFVEEYGDGGSAPEPFASCDGGLRPADSGAGAGTDV